MFHNNSTHILTRNVLFLICENSSPVMSAKAQTAEKSLDSIQGSVSCLIYFQQLSVMFVATQLCQSMK